MEPVIEQKSQEAEKKIVEEINKNIFKFAKKDIIETLTEEIGGDFPKYREEFNKTQDFLNTGFIPKSPITVSIELINKCNLKCVMCYTDHHQKPMKSMTLDTVDKIMKECHDEHIPSVIVGLGSEMMMYKDINEAMELVKKHGIMDVFFGSNGVLMNDKIIETLVLNQVSRVELSLDSATPETYQKIRSFDMLKRVETNIEKLIACKKKYNSVLPIIRLCFVVQDKNKHEVEAFIEKWQDKVDYLDFQRCIDFTNVDKEVDIDPAELKDKFCSYPFYSLNVYSSGDVSPCCTFYGKDLIIGNIHEKTLQEIWDGPEIKVIREQIRNKQFNKTCAKCLYFRDGGLIDKSLDEVNKGNVPPKQEVSDKSEESTIHPSEIRMKSET